jgi:hypothetical protein
VEEGLKEQGKNFQSSETESCCLILIHCHVKLLSLCLESEPLDGKDSSFCCE